MIISTYQAKLQRPLLRFGLLATVPDAVYNPSVCDESLLFAQCTARDLWYCSL